ncbi:GNAT family N-acetyltransferase [Clostridium sp. YIM B02551]|uniref:GNAT family N-acetyltransferase n=1 Tax=Clostridium sp. YIM B02551 TaxID=2910679 RepID=UPI0035A09EA4
MRELEQVCKTYDKLSGEMFLDNSLNFSKDVNNIFLAYENNQLVSLINIFVPTRHEAELSAYTHPDYRNRGYFRELLTSVTSELKKYKVKRILFTCEAQCLVAKDLIKKLGAKYAFTEYSLSYDFNHTENKILSSMKLSSPTIDDIPILISLGEDIFDENYEESKSIATKVFNAEDREQFLAEVDGKYIGMCSVRFENNEAMINGLGISPIYQGEGYGKDLVYSILNELIKRNIEKIAIEVDSDNDKAFNLYQKCGFKIETAFEYYKKNL